MVNLKQMAKDNINYYASPIPNVSRIGWQPVAEHGASRPTLENVFLLKYGDILNSAENKLYNIMAGKQKSFITPEQARALQQMVQNARNANQYRIMQNELKYNPNFLDGTY